MENLQNDTTEFEKISLKNDEILNFAVNQEKRVENIFKKLVASNSITKKIKRSLEPVETTPGIMYGLLKFTKISSLIARCFNLFCQQSISHQKISKVFVPILKSLTSNEYPLKDSLLLLRKLLKKILNFLCKA